MATDTPQLTEVVVGGTIEPWRALGFAVDANSRIALANGAIRVSGGPAGAHGLVVDGLATSVTVDGVSVEPGDGVPAADHPNGAFELDHIVITTDALERTSTAIEAALGLPQRRVREAGTDGARVRQAFHRFPRKPGGAGGCVIEVVEGTQTRGPATRLWGFVINVADLESLCERLGPGLIAQAKPAVQPGRLIATVRPGAGLGFPLALMSPVSA